MGGEGLAALGHEIWGGPLGGGEGLYNEVRAQGGPSPCEFVVELAHMGMS